MAINDSRYLERTKAEQRTLNRIDVKSNILNSAIFRCWVPLKKCQIVFHLEMIFSLHQNGPASTTLFSTQRESHHVNVVKSTAQPSEIKHIVRRTCQYVFNIKFKFKIRDNNSQWKRLKNSFRWQRLEVTQIQSRTFRQISLRGLPSN